MSSNYTPPNGSGQGWQYQSGPNGSGQRRPPRSTLREWIPIIVLFCIPSGVTQFIAVIWGLSKIISLIKSSKDYQEHLKNFGKAAADVTREVTDSFREEVNRASAKSAASSARSTPRKKVKVPGGIALVVLGIILACGCGFSALMCLISNSGIGFLVLSLLTLCGAGMLGGGINLNRRKERCINYLSYIGTNKQISLAQMAASFDIPVKKLCKELRWMLAKGILPTGYLDLAAGKLFLTKEGYNATYVEDDSAEEAQSPWDGRKARIKISGGTALVVLGIILACGCGIPALITLISGAEVGFAVLVILVLAGLGMLFGGKGLNDRRERCLNYLAYIGPNREVNLAHMAASFDIPVKKLCKELRWMLAKGILPTGYLDLAAGKLFLTEKGYRTHTPAPEASQTPTQTEGDEILREIRRINDAIPGEVMTAKIHRIEEITGKILAYQKAHPDRSGQLRSFLNYYLPTTLKILRAYAQLDAQGIEGENITATKARIEGMMDQVVAGFEKQLDKLFHSDAMDITSDVQVLEAMLKKTVCPIVPTPRP